MICLDTLHINSDMLTARDRVEGLLVNGNFMSISSEQMMQFLELYLSHVNVNSISRTTLANAGIFDKVEPSSHDE